MTNTRWGALAGGLTGVLAGLLAASALVGEAGYSPWMVAAVYVVGGILGGSIAGALAIHAGSWFWRGIIGVIAFAPITAMIFAIEAERLSTDEVKGIAAVSIVLGFPAGIIGAWLIRKIDPFGKIE